MEDETVSLLNKKTADLTVGDALKINLGILAIMAAVPVTTWAVSAAKERVSSWRKNRKNAKSDTTTEQ